MCSPTYISETDQLFNTCHAVQVQYVYEEQPILFMDGYKTDTLPTSFKARFRHSCDLHPHMYTRQVSNIYIDIPKTNWSKISLIILFQSCVTNV